MDAKVVELKVFFAGWYGSGKTTWIETLRMGRFPQDEYRPTVSDEYVTWERIVEDVAFELVLWDWFVQIWGEAHRLVELSFPGTDVCLLCYSVVDREHIPMFSEYWMPRLRANASECVFVLHAMQVDRRATTADAITRDEGEKLALRLGGIPYVESSALTGLGMSEVLDACCRAWLERSKQSPIRQRKTGCQFQ